MHGQGLARYEQALCLYIRNKHTAYSPHSKRLSFMLLFHDCKIILMFTLISFFLKLIPFLVLIYRLKQHPIRPYIAVFIAACLDITAEGLAAFVLDPYNDAWGSIISAFIIVIFGLVSSFTILLTILGCLRTWLISMKNAENPNSRMQHKANIIVITLFVVYPFIAIAYLASVMLVPILRLISYPLMMVAGITFALAVLVEVCLLFYLYANTLPPNQSTLQPSMTGFSVEMNTFYHCKQKQLLRLIVMLVCISLTLIFGAFLVQIPALIFSLLWYATVIWPRALVGFDEMPPKTMMQVHSNQGHPVV